MYRRLDPERDWSFFDEDIRVPEADRALIRPLTVEAARTLWEREVSSSPLQRHPMLLPAEHWLKPQTLGPNWLNEWRRDEGEQVDGFLQSMLQSSEGEIAYFIFMREDAYEAPVGILTKHWRAWLFLDDEGPFILVPTSGAYVGFGPNDNVFDGSRIDA